MMCPDATFARKGCGRTSLPHVAAASKRGSSGRACAHGPCPLRLLLTAGVVSALCMCVAPRLWDLHCKGCSAASRQHAMPLPDAAATGPPLGPCVLAVCVHRGAHARGVAATWPPPVAISLFCVGWQRAPPGPRQIPDRPKHSAWAGAINKCGAACNATVFLLGVCGGFGSLCLYQQQQQQTPCMPGLANSHACVVCHLCVPLCVCWAACTCACVCVSWCLLERPGWRAHSCAHERVLLRVLAVCRDGCTRVFGRRSWCCDAMQLRRAAALCWCAVAAESAYRLAAVTLVLIASCYVCSRAAVRRCHSTVLAASRTASVAGAAAKSCVRSCVRRVCHASPACLPPSSA